MIAISPAGDLFASAEGNDIQDRRTGVSRAVGTYQIRIWDTRTGEAVGRIPVENTVDAVDFSPNGDRLVARTAKGVVVYRVGDGTEIARFEFAGQRTAAGSVAFGPSGEHIFAESVDGVQMWSLQGTTSQLFRHGSAWPRYHLSEDGQLLVTFSRTLIHVWDVGKDASLFQLPFPDLYYRNAVLLGVNDDLVAATDSGLVRIPWRSDQLTAARCRRFVRDIGDGDWHRFFDEDLPAEICSPAPGIDQTQTRN